SWSCRVCFLFIRLSTHARPVARAAGSATRHCPGGQSTGGSSRARRPSRIFVDSESDRVNSSRRIPVVSFNRTEERHAPELGEKALCLGRLGCRGLLSRCLVRVRREQGREEECRQGRLEDVLSDEDENLPSLARSHEAP